jgi:hypothetical protein
VILESLQSVKKDSRSQQSEIHHYLQFRHQSRRHRGWISDGLLEISVGLIVDTPTPWFVPTMRRAEDGDAHVARGAQGGVVHEVELASLLRSSAC